MSREYLKILIIRFSSIGDIVLTTPVIRNLRKTYPDADLHFLTKKKFSPLISENPYINHFHLYEDNLIEIIKTLKRERFDCIIDLHHNLRTLFIKFFLGTKSFSFRKLNIEKWLMVKFKFDRLPRIHIVDRYVETVDKLGVKNDGLGLDYFQAASDLIVINRLFPAIEGKFIALVLSGTYRTKKFPNHRIIRLCNKINIPVLLLGGKNEEEDAAIIANALPENIIGNAVNKLSLGQSASVISQAYRVITNDTGMMHIAAAFKKQIISVWGNTIPEFGMTPYFGVRASENELSFIAQVSNLPCRPCSKLGFDKCPKTHFKCMNDISEESIVKAL